MCLSFQTYVLDSGSSRLNVDNNRIVLDEVLMYISELSPAEQ